MSFLGTFGTLSVIVLFYVLAKLSERLGSVEKMSPLYRYYYVAMAFAGVGYIANLVAARVNLTPQSFPEWMLQPWLLMVTYYIPMAISVSIGLAVSWRYWSWLVALQRK